MATRIILSHIAHNAKPIFSNVTTTRTAAELGFDAPATARKRRRGKGVKDDSTLADEDA